jgi:hypothetical protein
MLAVVGHGPDQIGSLGKPPASSAFLPLSASSRTGLPTLPTHQCRYEAIRVWSSTNFIDRGKTIGRNLKG